MEQDQAPAGFFITVEGGEGAGKSTQIARLRDRLAGEGRRVVTTREPGGSSRAEAIRSILLSGHAKRFGSFAECLLFAAARADHLDRLIRPALDAGAVVLCDRFLDSTRVYQGMVAGLPDPILSAFDQAATAGTQPDLTLVIDVPAKLGLERARLRRAAREEAADRFEGEGGAYHEKVREGFLAIARSEPGRCVVVDGSEGAGRVEAAIWAAVSARLDRAGACDVA